MEHPRWIPGTQASNLRREIVRILRTHRPDILVTCDPQNLYPSATYGINHPDHRYAGQVVLDAVFPAAGNPHYFPELLKEEGLEPWAPGEVWVSIPAANNVNVTLDVTDMWDTKIQHSRNINPRSGTRISLKNESAHAELQRARKPVHGMKKNFISYKLK